MLRSIFIFNLFLLVGAQLQGQEGAARSVDLSVFAVAYAEGYRKVYLADHKGEIVNISLSNANVLGPYKTTLDADSNLILRTKSNDETGAVIYPPIAQIRIQNSIKEPLVILIPSSGNEPYRALVIERSLKGFPNGSYALINFSSMDIRGLVGKTKIVAPARNITTFDPSSNSEEMLNVHFQCKQPDRWKTFGRTRWVNAKNKRSLLLAYPDQKTGRMKIKGIPLRPSSSARVKKK